IGSIQIVEVEIGSQQGSVDTIGATDIDYLQVPLVPNASIIGEDPFEDRLGPIWKHIVQGQTRPKIGVRPPAIVAALCT
ncbi:hypothetical protein, partial [Mesorhizobium sp.]|uniref:hypothetical protein n=1 Tax=Mesorhizobium sp. TaxID=1871066 RepID=UPI0025BE959A